MQIQSTGATVNSGNTSYQNAFNERVFRVARNSNTATLTVTAATISRGNPVNLVSESASVTNGFDVKATDTAGQLINNLLMGVAYDYPDTSSARTGTWAAEDVGIVQIYGLHTNLRFNQTTKTDTFAAGIMLQPDTGLGFKTAAVLSAGSATVASSVIFTAESGVAGLVILAQTLASAASETRVGVSGFIRCM